MKKNKKNASSQRNHSDKEKRQENSGACSCNKIFKSTSENVNFSDTGFIIDTEKGKS